MDRPRHWSMNEQLHAFSKTLKLDCASTDVLAKGEAAKYETVVQTEADFSESLSPNKMFRILVSFLIRFCVISYHVPPAGVPFELSASSGEFPSAFSFSNSLPILFKRPIYSAKKQTK